MAQIVLSIMQPAGQDSSMSIWDKIYTEQSYVEYKQQVLFQWLQVLKNVCKGILSGSTIHYKAVTNKRCLINGRYGLSKPIIQLDCSVMSDVILNLGICWWFHHIIKFKTELMIWLWLLYIQHHDKIWSEE